MEKGKGVGRIERGGWGEGDRGNKRGKVEGKKGKEGEKEERGKNS